MLARKEHEKKGIVLPIELKNATLTILQNEYAQQLIKSQNEINLHSFIWPDELLVIVSLKNKVEHFSSPISFFCSLDLQNSNVKEIQKHLDLCLDATSSFLDSLFSRINHEDEEIFLPNWQAEKYKQQEIWIKISHEDIEMTMAADALLD